MSSCLFFGGMDMEKQRIIFDLDKTLLTMDPTAGHEYFKSIYGEEANHFLEKLDDWLELYEYIFPRYEEDILASYLSQKSNLIITPDIVEEWIHVLAEGNDTMEPEVYEVLDYLKSKDKSLAVLTNWFKDTQITRLERAYINEFFDDVYTGEYFLKPHKESYWTAVEYFHPDECLFVGDHIEKDYIGPKSCGLDAVLYDKNDVHHKSLVKIKELGELTEIIRR